MAGWHQEIISERLRDRTRNIGLREVDHARLSITKEPSGEVRVTARMPKRAKHSRSQAVAAAAKSAGCASLVYSDKVRESDGKKSGFGKLARLTEFGKAGRRMVKNACGALKTKYGKKIVFATLTLAGSTDAARKTLAEWSGKVVELLTHWIRYHAPKGDYVYVWEHQKSGALHLHAAIGHHDVLLLRKLEKQFKNYIYDLHEKLSELSGLDVFERASGGSWKGYPDVIRSNCVPVKKCVKRYMAKYLTKANAGKGFYPPSRYWGLANSLRALVVALRSTNVWEVEDWNEVPVAIDGLRMRARELGVKLFEYHPPFAPHDVTLLIYPDEEQRENVLQNLDSLLVCAFGCSATWAA